MNLTIGRTIKLDIDMAQLSVESTSNDSKPTPMYSIYSYYKYSHSFLWRRASYTFNAQAVDGYFGGSSAKLESSNYSYIFPNDTRTHFVVDKGLITVGTTQIDDCSSTTSTSTGKLYIGYCPYDTSATYIPMEMKIYGLKVWDNDVLLRDCIPVLRKSDSKPCLYDLVSGEFYLPQTGDFTYGALV